MKLVDLFGEGLKVALTATRLSAWPNPLKGIQHSGQVTMYVDPLKKKVRVPDFKKGKKLFDKG